MKKENGRKKDVPTLFIVANGLLKALSIILGAGIFVDTLIIGLYVFFGKTIHLNHIVVVALSILLVLCLIFVIAFSIDLSFYLYRYCDESETEIKKFKTIERSK